MAEREKNDWYPTPFKATEKLLRVEDFDKTVWEPAAGDGAISVVLEDSGYKTISTDLNDYGFCDAGVDFLMETERKADSLVTNPPYKLADEFVKHAIYLGVEKHAWLLRLSFLEGGEASLQHFQHQPAVQSACFQPTPNNLAGVTMWTATRRSIRAARQLMRGSSGTRMTTAA